MKNERSICDVSWEPVPFWQATLVGASFEQHRKSDSDTDIRAACVDGEPELLASALARGANINGQDADGHTPLHLAVIWKHREIVDLLIARDADPNVVNRHGNGPLWAAVLNAKNDNSIVESLLKAQADPYQKHKANRSPIEMARKIGHGLEVPFTDLWYRYVA